MKCKKILALVLSCVMLLSLLAACDTQKPVETQSKETEGSTKPVETTPPTTEDPGIVFPLEEQMEVSVMVTMGNAAYSVTDNLAWQYLQEMSNIKFNVTEFAASEVSEKAGLLMNSGEYTDVIFKVSALDANKYGMDGILIPLEEMIREYMPNLCALLDERDGWNTITAGDGHIYAIPMVQNGYQMGAGGMTWWINKGWLDKLGLEMPTSPEELYNVLKAFKERDPNGNGKADEIPLGAHNTHTSHNALLGYFGEGLGYSNYRMIIDGKLEYLPTTEWYKDNALKFYKQLWDEGLVNPEMFTMDRDQSRAVCGGEDVIYGMIWDSTPTYFADPEECFNWVALQPFDKSLFAIDNGLQKNGMSITDKCQNPEVLLAWADFLYSEEGGRVIRMGVEDVTYKINDDGTYEMIKDGFENVTFQGTLMGSATVPGKIHDIYYGKPVSLQTQHVNKELYSDGYGAFNGCALMPNIVLSEEETEEYSVLYADVNSYMRTYFAECVTGLKDIDATWDEFQATMKEMGVDRMEQIQQAAYDRAMGN